MLFRRTTIELLSTARTKVLPILLLIGTLLPAVILVAVEVYAKQDTQLLSYNRYAMFLVPVIGIFVAARRRNSSPATCASGR